MDAPSFLTVELHAGYAMPDKSNRITCFEPETGLMLPMYQVAVEDCEDIGDGKFRLKFGDTFLSFFKPECERATALGNFICMEVRTSESMMMMQ